MKKWIIILIAPLTLASCSNSTDRISTDRIIQGVIVDQVIHADDVIGYITDAELLNGDSWIFLDATKQQLYYSNTDTIVSLNQIQNIRPLTSPMELECDEFVYIYDHGGLNVSIYDHKMNPINMIMLTRDYQSSSMKIIDGKILLNPTPEQCLFTAYSREGKYLLSIGGIKKYDDDVLINHIQNRMIVDVVLDSIVVAVERSGCRYIVYDYKNNNMLIDTIIDGCNIEHNVKYKGSSIKIKIIHSQIAIYRKGDEWQVFVAGYYKDNQYVLTCLTINGKVYSRLVLEMPNNNEAIVELEPRSDHILVASSKGNIIKFSIK